MMINWAEKQAPEDCLATETVDAMTQYGQAKSFVESEDRARATGHLEHAR